MKKNWEENKLGEVIRLEYGKPLPKSKRNISGKYPVYGANGEISRSNDYYCNKKSIIVGRKGSAGEINITENRFWPLDVTYFVTFDQKQYDLKFIYNLLCNLRLPKLAKGVKPGINRNDVYSINVHIPPLPEQKRIVKILDKVFENTTKAKENAEKNFANTRELFQSYLQDIFTNSGNGWEEKKLGEISNIEYGFTDKAKDSGEFRYVRITDIDDYGNLEPTNKMYLKFSKEAEKFLLENNDLLMARTGASFAKVLLYQNIEKSIFASYLIRIRFTEKIISKLYWYFSKSKFYWDQANKLSSGSAQPQFNGGALKQLVFSYPKSFPEQRSIVKKLDSLSVETKKLENIYKQKLNNLEELRKSVLQKAFNGEL